MLIDWLLLGKYIICLFAMKQFKTIHETIYFHTMFVAKYISYSLIFYRMLSISEVPTLVVINNKTGKVITLKGMEAIEWSEEGKPSLTFEKWRNGSSAVPLSATISKSCSIS